MIFVSLESIYKEERKMGTALTLKELTPLKDKFTLKGKVALVTGGAGGIGRSSAAVLAEMGADIALADLRVEIAQENADYIAEKFGVKAIALSCDVGDPDSVQALIDQVVAEFGRLDVVFANAGIAALDDTCDISYESWQKVMDINLTGVFLVDQRAAQWMRANGVKGSIINTASMSGHIINRPHGDDTNSIAYCVSKYGAIGITKAMALGFVKDGIRINCISPGYMYSGLHDDMPPERLVGWTDDVPMGRFGTMDEIGALVGFLASDASSYMTGSDVVIDGGYTIW